MKQAKKRTSAEGRRRCDTYQFRSRSNEIQLSTAHIAPRTFWTAAQRPGAWLRRPIDREGI
jgi:hypothetical protein